MGGGKKRVWDDEDEALAEIRGSEGSPLKRQPVCERSRLISIDPDPATDVRALKVGMHVTLRLGSPPAAYSEIGLIGVVGRRDAPQMQACLRAGYRIDGEVEGVDIGVARIHARVAGLPKVGTSVNTSDVRTGVRHLWRGQGFHGRRDSTGYPPGKRDTDEYAEGLFTTEGPLCGACPFREPCGAMTSVYACLPWYGRDAPGGLEALHPHNLDFAESISRLGGACLDIDARRGIAIPRLPSFLAGINVRAALKEQAQRAGGFHGARSRRHLENRVRPASEFRSRLGLGDKQLIVLLLFGKDRLLETLWEHRETLLPQIAAGGFDAVTAPSYSLWIPWPRPNHLLSLKKSLLIFRSLQELGVAAIPRLAWAVTRDVERHAEWCGRNDHVDTVALDLTTYRTPADWLEQNWLLAEFDRLTNERLHYLVNGPSVRGRYRDIQNSTAPERAAFTNATFVGPPPKFTKTESPGDSFAMARIRIHERAIAA